MSKRDKIIYWIATGLLSAMMMMSAGMYLFNNAMVSETFSNLGFPSYIIYPLAVAKILGVIAIVSNKSKALKEWAYAGFFFDFVLAAAAHVSISDGDHMGAIVAIVLLFVSYFFGQKR
ncbi:DoxX family protein [Carboxylicivirga sp. M1479]|uniref:DoxX family protein n=1 Tax=Carboxylicivirga sp. M1479 TaxID=2594476 RepID=UPI001177BA53|nr:DoxX family protein [Carboxylicivirga sp. M1479]TRX70777.1 DoxX family protein [Carboxylicivirga sp. M1479]